MMTLTNKNLLLLCLSLIFLNTNYAGSVHYDENELQWLQSFEENINLETGSLIILNQRLKEKGINTDIPYTVTFICISESSGQDSCKLMDIGFRVTD